MLIRSTRGPTSEENERRMPTYEYTCRDCGEALEVVQSFTDEPLAICPACGGALRKVFGAVGISFKGSGFYKTDSRSGAKTSSSSASSSSSSDSSSDTSSSGSSDKSSSGSADKSTSGSSDKSTGGSADKSAGGSAAKAETASA
jgi:putative FmdB family regulatory protein